MSSAEFYKSVLSYHDIPLSDAPIIASPKPKQSLLDKSLEILGIGLILGGLFSIVRDGFQEKPNSRVWRDLQVGNVLVSLNWIRGYHQSKKALNEVKEFRDTQQAPLDPLQTEIVDIHERVIKTGIVQTKIGLAFCTILSCAAFAYSIFQREKNSAINVPFATLGAMGAFNIWTGHEYAFNRLPEKYYPKLRELASV